jgi:DNA-binding CsgD family transcriptional regulator
MTAAGAVSMPGHWLTSVAISTNSNTLSTLSKGCSLRSKRSENFAASIMFMGAWYLSRVISDHAQVDGETLFWQRDVPKGFRVEYFDWLDRKGPTPTQHLARRQAVPFTITEAMGKLRTSGDDWWQFDVMRKHGIRDGYYVPFYRWALFYWSANLVKPSPFERKALAGAAYLSMLRIEELVPSPERFESKCVFLGQREKQCLRLAATGLEREGIAAKLEITKRMVKYHTERAKQKLGARNIVEAVALALRYKILE